MRPAPSIAERRRRRDKRLLYRLGAGAIPVRHFDQTGLRATGYLSQCGRDKWLIETVLPGLDGGVFVDIGAHDGVS